MLSRAWMLSLLTACGSLLPTADPRLARVTALVAEARGRPLDVPEVREVSDEQLERVARAQYLQVPEEVRTMERRRGRALGVQADDDPMEALLSSARLRGLWSPDDDVLYVDGGLPPDQAEAVWQHELTHALQDRHFHLDPASAYDWPVDLAKAWALLMEGEATYVPLMITYGAAVVDWTPLADLGVREPRGPRSVTQRYLAGNLRTYAVGPAVIQTLRQQGGWDAVDARWRSLPLSTEQLLEPDRADDLPRTVALDLRDVLPPGWTADAPETLGQQEMYDILWASLPEAEGRVADAVRGWDGDRLQVLIHDAGVGFVWRSVWDSPEDAAAFAALVAQWRPRGAPPVLEIRGEEVLVASGVPETVQNAAWRGSFFEVGSFDALLAAHRATREAP